LVKLEVDFVEDAYKLNCRGYQVTNLRCKNYQNTMMHQFKLERWMEYGPTIAAAFAAPQEKDVLNLRVIISEMMRRHPQQQQFTVDSRPHAIHQTRTYDSSRYEDSERHNGDGDGRHYISGSASAGALSDGASVKSARTNRSYGVVDNVNKLVSKVSDAVKR